MNDNTKAAPQGVASKATGYVALKGRYVPPVLFNPYSGEPRDVRDIHSDPQGVLIVPPGASLVAAQTGQASLIRCAICITTHPNELQKLY